MTTFFSNLEDFGRNSAHQSVAQLIPEVEIEEIKLNAFENGYKAGWDDAVKAQAEDQSRVSADLARNLEDLSFTYQEALNAMVKAMAPVLSDAIEKILPDLSQDALAMTVREQAERFIRSEAQSLTGRISVAPGSMATVSALMQGSKNLPFELVESDTLAEGQAIVSFGRKESSVDVSEVVTEIRSAMAGALFEIENVKSYA